MKLLDSLKAVHSLAKKLVVSCMCSVQYVATCQLRGCSVKSGLTVSTSVCCDTSVCSPSLRWRPLGQALISHSTSCDCSEFHFKGKHKLRTVQKMKCKVWVEGRLFFLGESELISLISDHYLSLILTMCCECLNIFVTKFNKSDSKF